MKNASTPMGSTVGGLAVRSTISAGPDPDPWPTSSESRDKYVIGTMCR